MSLDNSNLYLDIRNTKTHLNVFTISLKGLVYKGTVDVTSECVRVFCTNTELGTRWMQADTNEPIHSCSKGNLL